MRYFLTDEELRAVQLVQLELLKEVRRICELYNIKYTIIAGTLLGAVRHKGYIPWDDDADIAMLREEYEKFTKACKVSLNHELYYFQDYESVEGYRWGYGKLRKKNTLFLREGQEDMPYKQGVFIDIFPLDYVSNKRYKRSIQNFYCFCIRKVLWSRVGKKTDKCVLKRRIYSVLDKIPERIIKNYLSNYVKRCNKRKTQWVRILMFPTPNTEYGYLVKWYEELQNIEFEQETFCGIKDYDEYLSFKFGDYMELPPENQRKAHPVSSLKV